jgi:serine/threonine protein kinase
VLDDAFADPLAAARVKHEVSRRLFGGAVPPLSIGRFEVKERIGAGGMSVVYRAHDPELGRDVAIKLLQAGGRTERLRREARALAKLRHPNVVSVYEVGSWAEHPFLALEHVVGSTLSEWARARPRRAEEIARLVADVARGLHAVHELGLVHRDVKPDNVVVDARGVARLIDFGLVTDEPEAAQAPDAAPNALTRDGATPGTPRYMAPELAGGAPSTPGSDQFSLGVTLDEITRGASRTAAMERVIARATSREPRARFADLAQLADALETAAGPPRSRPWIVGIAATLAAGALGAAIAVGGESPRTREREETVTTRDETTHDPPWIAPLLEGTSSDEARAAQRRGLLGHRAGDDAAALGGFERAVALDPSYGAAELGLAMVYAQGTVGEARPHLARALASRASMSPRARVVLEALRPCVEDDPIDAARCEQSLADAAQAHEDEPLLWYELARQRRHREGFSEAIVDAFDHALALDPGLGRAFVAQGQTLAYLGRFDEALAMTERCLEAAPTTTSCHRDRLWILQAMGDCEAVEIAARRWRDALPGDPHPLWALAGAASARGEPSAVIEQLLIEARAPMPPEQRAYFEARDPVILAIARGDFTRASEALEGFDARAFASPSGPSTDRAFRLVPHRLAILVALETGDPSRAASLAEDAMARMRAWPADPRTEDFGMARDSTPFLLDVLRETHAIDDEERTIRRDVWLAEWRARTTEPYHPFLWLNGYAAHVDDAHEAREATAARGSLSVQPFHPLSRPELGLARWALHEGREDDAMAALSGVADGCHAPDLDDAHETWWQRPRAALELGELHARRGEHERACARYAEVLARWGDARPSSVTADRARAARTALGCSP